VTADEIRREKWLIERIEALWDAVGTLAAEVKRLSGDDSKDQSTQLRLVRGGDGEKP